MWELDWGGVFLQTADRCKAPGVGDAQGLQQDNRQVPVVSRFGLRVYGSELRVTGARCPARASAKVEDRHGHWHVCASENNSSAGGFLCAREAC